jgi:hypothetical protein
MAEFQLTEDRRCPSCEKLFLATVVLTVTEDGTGKKRASAETLCPDCGTAGERLI